MAKPTPLRPTSSQNSHDGTPSILPRPDFHFPGEVGRTYLDSEPAQFPQPVQAPQGAPNILLILIDDCGFGQSFFTAGGNGLHIAVKNCLERLRGLPFRMFWSKLLHAVENKHHLHVHGLLNPKCAVVVEGSNAPLGGERNQECLPS
jgi:hypothetical protein